MNEIVNILCERDGISYNEACDIYEQCQREIMDAIDYGASLDEVENIIADYVGLEPDYIWCFI